MKDINIENDVLQKYLLDYIRLLELEIKTIKKQ